jgi:adenylate kinase family enzyme
MSGKIIIISGPAGVGKSTTACVFAEKLKKSAYVSGDTVSHMAVAGREKPWESEGAKELIWENIKDITKNFLDYGCDVVVDWIVFWDDIKQYAFDWIEQGIEVRYIILWAEENAHVERDRQRPEEIQMGERVLILRNEFLNSSAPSRFFLDNTTTDIDTIIKKIQLDSRFLLSNADS